MFADLDWPLNASRWFVSISWASALYFVFKHLNTCWQIRKLVGKFWSAVLVQKKLKLTPASNVLGLVTLVNQVLLFLSPLVLPNSKGIPSAGTFSTRGRKCSQLSANISINLRTRTRYGTRLFSIEPCHFRWLRVTLKAALRHPETSPTCEHFLPAH